MFDRTMTRKYYETDDEESEDEDTDEESDNDVKPSIWFIRFIGVITSRRDLSLLFLINYFFRLKISVFVI